MNPIIINRNNYEEFLLLYVDDELTAEEKKAVEDFLLLHPDLQTELDGLMSTKLLPGAAAFGDKTPLLADSMKQNTVDESLLLYIDDELSPAEKQQVEERLQKEEAFQRQHQLLRKAKLDPQEVIPYPHKKELYRTTERRIGVPSWLLIAAAFLLIAGMGVVYVMEQTGQPAGITVTHQPNPQPQPKKTNGSVALNAEQDKVPAPEDQLVQVSVVNTKGKTAVRTAVNKTKGAAETPPVIVARKKENTPSGIVAGPTVTAPQLSVVESPVQSLEANKKEATAAVTPEPLRTYNDKETVMDVEPVYASEIMEENRGRSPLKGFLRKATRLLERRANINAANNDDELLIGAVSIKLN